LRRIEPSILEMSSSDGWIRPGLVTITPANVAAINARLGAVGYQGPLVTTGIYPNPVRHHQSAAQG
jgi:hypothetical protein